MKQDIVLCASKEGFHRIAYTEWGAATLDSRALICVHGLTRNSRDFDFLANYMSHHGRHVFCPDVAGRGDSDWFSNSQSYNFDHYVMDMTTLMARTGATEFDWIGTSMGGLIGMMIAAMPGSPIRRLVLNDVGPQIPIHALWEMGKYVSKDPDFHSIEEATDYFKKIYAEFGNLSEEQWDYFTQHSIVERSPGIYTSKFDPNIHDSRIKMQSVKDFFYSPHKAFEGWLFDIDLWSTWLKVKCPVLVIRGKNSKLLLPEHIERMKRSHEALDLMEVENAGHAPALMDEREQMGINEWLR